MFASEKWYNVELAWYEWEGFREALKKDGEEWASRGFTRRASAAWTLTARDSSISKLNALPLTCPI